MCIEVGSHMTQCGNEKDPSRKQYIDSVSPITSIERNFMYYSSFQSAEQNSTVKEKTYSLRKKERGFDVIHRMKSIIATTTIQILPFQRTNSLTFLTLSSIYWVHFKKPL